MESNMGSIDGEYRVEKNRDKAIIYIDFSKGWNPERNTLLSKIVFNKSSEFRVWPKSYQYRQEINLKTGESISNWSRI